MKTNLTKFQKVLFFGFILSFSISCNTTEMRVFETDLVGRFSVTVSYDSKKENLDFLFDIENFAQATEFEFFKSGTLDCIFEGDPMGAGTNYGLSMNSIIWELDKNIISFTVPTESSSYIKKVSIEKDVENIVLKTDNVVYLLKKK